MSIESYIVVVSYEFSYDKEFLSAKNRNDAVTVCEKHFKRWALSLAETKAIQWGGYHVKDGDTPIRVYVNTPNYKTYPTSFFEELRCWYPKKVDFIDSVYKPDNAARGTRLLEMEKQYKNENSDFWVYAIEELEKLGYVYSAREQLWYPPNGISV